MTYSTSHGYHSHKNIRALSMALHIQTDYIQTGPHALPNHLDVNPARTPGTMDLVPIPRDVASLKDCLRIPLGNHREIPESIFFYCGASSHYLDVDSSYCR